MVVWPPDIVQRAKVKASHIRDILRRTDNGSRSRSF
jgi:hypothetical protein